MTKQEIFDQVCEHLARQKRRSANARGNCLYRGPDGLMCAVGCLLTDEEAEGQEGSAASDITLPARLAPHVELLDYLQTAHDSNTGTAPYIMASLLRNVANLFNLNPAKTDLITEWTI